MINILKMMVTSSPNIFKSWHLLDIYFGWLFPLFPETEVINEFLESLTLQHRWTLTLPALLLQIITFSQIKSSLQS